MRPGCRLTARHAAAMVVAPALRCRLIARLRRVARTAGPCPVRICDRSSSTEASRTQCSRFSMPQCARAASASSAALVCSKLRSVIA